MDYFIRCYNHLIMKLSGPAISSWLKTQHWSESPLCITQSSPLVHRPTPMVSVSYKLKQINYMSLKLQPFFCNFEFTNCKMTVVSNGQSIGGRAPVDVALYLKRKRRNVMSSSAGILLCFCFVLQLGPFDASVGLLRESRFLDTYSTTINTLLSKFI